MVGVSSMNIHFGEILWSKKQTQAILKVKEQRRNTLQIKKPTDQWPISYVTQYKVR